MDQDEAGKKAEDSAGFGQWLVESEASPAYREFCRRVYGTGFVQFNMAGVDQLEALAAALAGASRVVDLGCGIGSQAEFVAERTGAFVLGVDFAAAAIERARNRTAARRDRVDFRVADLDALDLPPASFDAAMALDTLYFVRSLPATIRAVTEALTPGGRLVALFTQKRRDGDPESILEPGGTALAAALDAAGFTYATTDFTAAERRIWEASLAESEALQDRYEAEGHEDYRRSQVEEARRNLDFHEAGRMRRYLYAARARI